MIQSCNEILKGSSWEQKKNRTKWIMYALFNLIIATTRSLLECSKSWHNVILLVSEFLVNDDFDQQSLFCQDLVSLY